MHVFLYTINFLLVSVNNGVYTRVNIYCWKLRLFLFMGIFKEHCLFMFQQSVFARSFDVPVMCKA